MKIAWSRRNPERTSTQTVRGTEAAIAGSITFNRVILIVIDACGVGELPDASSYGDNGAATIPNVARAVGGLSMPTCERLGLGHIVPIAGIQPAHDSFGAWGKMVEQAAGKDSTTGHWELAGYIIEQPLPLFPNGFPPALVQAIERETGRKTIGNKAASGTEIIAELGDEQLKSGALILYTSADSVLQIAAHEDVIPLVELYQYCRTARLLCSGDYNVGRVIARPFVGTAGEFIRTAGRKDFTRLPSGPTVLDLLVASGRDVLAIGKIYDLFGGRGITESIKTSTNLEVMSAVRNAVKTDTRHSLIFANCVDFDQTWGHRNDEQGFARSLEEFDRELAELLPVLRGNDLLLITADHGCDPTLKSSTDHTREYVPLLCFSPGGLQPVSLGVRSTFADVAATIADIFMLPYHLAGESFRVELRRR